MNSLLGGYAEAASLPRQHRCALAWLARSESLLRNVMLHLGVSPDAASFVPLFKAYSQAPCLPEVVRLWGILGQSQSLVTPDVILYTAAFRAHFVLHDTDGAWKVFDAAKMQTEIALTSPGGSYVLGLDERSANGMARNFLDKQQVARATSVVRCANQCSCGCQHLCYIACFDSIPWHFDMASCIAAG